MPEPGETAVVPAAAVAALEPRSIIAPAGNFSTYMTSLIERARFAVAACDERIAEAQRGMEASKGVPDQQTQLSKWKRELTKRLKVRKQRGAFLSALEAGYVPLPKMPAVRLEHAMHTMPPDVLDAMKEAREAGVFEEFRVIDGRGASKYGWPESYRAEPHRDPIIVGLIAGEPFAVAWWRP